ncbi:hypothetical protein MIS45_00015 [Wielerella bovis]|uniref:hypothetical protein n=1 Tax=Wielerella bovis TaxID=2917790 RepID=UPI002018E4C6|nr:hypothetical protein [Wielerella bovis]ULJ69306.1 hypothetical protein MIS45_00015 [Wielerella bovis]
MMNYNYEQGVEHMRTLVEKATNRNQYSNSFNTNTNLIIQYPGHKRVGDYRLLTHLDEPPPKHTDIVQIIFDMTNNENYLSMIQDLEEIYSAGLKAHTDTIPNDIKDLIFWITLQEEINYPPPRMGRKLPFQRYFEAILAKQYPNIIKMQEVINRTNNHGGRTPSLLSNQFNNNIDFPIFYN